MSAHLTHEELTDNLLGVSSLTVNAHLMSCPACATELDRLKSSIADFRGATHAWSENAVATNRSLSVVRTPPRTSWAANWVLASAAMILFALGFTFYVRDYQARNQPNSAHAVADHVSVTEGPQSQIEKDNELLSQVNSELAEAVPAPMQPLRLLDSTTSNASTTK